MSSVLSIDVGSSSVKSALVDKQSAQIIGPVGHQDYSLDHPTPEAAEVPPERVWAALVSAVRQAIPGELGAGVSGIGLSCMTPALVLLDRDDRVLSPVWTHLDRRARSVAKRIWAEVGPEFMAATGNRPLPGGISAVCFTQALLESPSLRDHIYSYLHLNGWLGLRLTGQKYFDSANASFTGLSTLSAGNEWSRRWCGYFNVDEKWLPPIVDGRTTIGTLLARVAEELDLPVGLPVKMGTADTTSAMLSVAFKPTDLLHVVGTTQVLLRVVAQPEPAERRLVRRLGVGEGFVHVTHNPVGGAALEWVRELCFRDIAKRDFYDQVLPACAGRKTSVRLDPPFLGGDRLEIEASYASFLNLSLWSRREDLLAAVLESMRRGHEEALAALGGNSTFNRVFLTGGGASTLRALLPGYEPAEVFLLENGSLRGVARLFDSD